MEQVRRGRSSATLDLNINPRRLRLADQNSRERSYVSVQYIDMTINPTYLAQRSRSCTSNSLRSFANALTFPQPLTGQMRNDEFSDHTANGSELYADFPPDPRRTALLIKKKSPEIQSMYSLNMPVSKIRTKVRQEFEKHRYVNHLQAVDVLLQQSHAEFQVRLTLRQYKSDAYEELFKGNT